MFLNNLKQKSLQFARPLLYNRLSLFGTHAPPPEKLQKVKDICIYFNVKNNYGAWEKIPAFVGESVQQSLLRMKVLGMHIESCHGGDMIYRPHQRPHDPFSDGPQCGLCQIILTDNWHEKVMRQTEGTRIQQEQLLFNNVNTPAKSRLACCIPVQKWMDGMSIQVVPIHDENDRNIF